MNVMCICLGAVLFFSYLATPIECFVSTTRTSVVTTYSTTHNVNIRRGPDRALSLVPMSITSILSSNNAVLSAILAVSAIGITLEQQTTCGKALSVSCWVCCSYLMLIHLSSNPDVLNNHTGSTCDDVDIINLGKHWPDTIQIASLYNDQQISSSLGCTIIFI